MTGRRIHVEGIVQGVGFRPWIYRLAREEGIAGEVRNGGSGVTIDAYGSDAAVTTFLRRLRESPPPAAAIRSLAFEELDDPDPGEPAPERFHIGASEPAGATHAGAAAETGARKLSIPADLATCDRCLEEVFDPANRRFRYPFTNCTDCGPRYTIALGVPYDRPATTMAPFPMCDACRREYEDPEDRRFHAQPNACPECGPRLTLLTPDGHPLDGRTGDGALAGAADALRRGRVVAVHGLGGFHLACLASSNRAVRRLRRRKRRPAKPLAVMVPDLAAARRLARPGPAEEALLAAVERPIVLVPLRTGDGRRRLAEEVAPGNPLVGLLLPYTPLHHLLLDAVGEPLVMTSGNRSGEPIAHRVDQAVERLGGIADLLLVHDREIAGFCDDSVARVVDGAPLVMRRSRGWVPRPLELPEPLPAPVLATGGDLKNTFCLGVGDRAYLGPHVGDLEDLATLEAYEEAVERMVRFVGVEPEVVAHDLNPSYGSTRFAAAHPAPVKVGVQHHHAHLLSCLAEHGRRGPAVGVVLDGTGYGTDGTAWGAEVLLGDPSGGYRRLATTRAFPLPGGETAIRQVWRTATALLWDAFEGHPTTAALSLVRAPLALRGQVLRLLASDLPSPRVRGAGRYFDGVGALVLDVSDARFEGEVATALNLELTNLALTNLALTRADGGRRRGAGAMPEAASYPWTVICEGGLPTLDLRPTVRALVDDRLGGARPAAVAARFHQTWIQAMAEIAGAEARRHRLPVALSGGCLQNDVLSRGLARRLADDGVEVLSHRQVPPGDGGLALGQVVAAGQVVRNRSARNRSTEDHTATERSTACV